MTTSQQAPQVDGPRLMRVVTDSQYVAMADSFLRTAPNAKRQDVFDVIDLRTQAQDRLAGDREFVLALSRQMGEDGLTAEIARAVASDPAAGAGFREKAQAEGGVLAYVEERLDGMAGTWAAEREKDAGADIAFAAGSTGCCVGGVLLIVGGAGVTIFGPKLIGPVAEVVGPAAVVVGVVTAASCC